jgi:hypothetical protein
VLPLARPQRVLPCTSHRRSITRPTSATPRNKAASPGALSCSIAIAPSAPPLPPSDPGAVSPSHLSRCAPPPSPLQARQARLPRRAYLEQPPRKRAGRAVSVVFATVGDEDGADVAPREQQQPRSLLPVAPSSSLLKAAARAALAAEEQEEQEAAERQRKRRAEKMPRRGEGGGGGGGAAASAHAGPSRLGKLMQNVNVAGTALFFRILLVSGRSLSL